MKLVRYRDEYVTNKYELDINDDLAFVIERSINEWRGANQPALEITVKMLEDVVNGDFMNDGTHDEPYEWEQELTLPYVAHPERGYFTEDLSKLIGDYITDYIYDNFVETTTGESYEYEDEVIA